MTAALEAVDLRFSAGGVEILHGVSLTVAPGEVVAVVGPSGSGKSTLLHLLGGLARPTAGELWWAGARVDGLSVEARARLRARRLGLVFQHHYLLNDLNVVGNLALPLSVAGLHDPARAAGLLERIGLAGKAEAWPAQLSGGERQRVALARALAARPALLLADEPTGSLDRANAASVAKLMLALAREDGAGVLLVTHDEALAARADRALHLLDGRFEGAGHPSPAGEAPA